MARKRKAPKSLSNGEASEAQKPARSSKRSKAKAMAEEEDFVLEHNDVEADDENVGKEEDFELLEEVRVPRVAKGSGIEEESVFIGKPVDIDDAKRRRPHRYLLEIEGGAEAEASKSEVKKCQAHRHYTQARVDGCTFDLGNDAHVMAGEREDNYICRIVEMLEHVDGEPYITAQWFYRAKDTVIKDCSDLIEDKRVFLSTIQDDNHLDCLLSNIKIVQRPLNADIDTKLATVAICDYYYDMLYYVPFSNFLKPQQDGTEDGNKSVSTISSEIDVRQDEGNKNPKEMKLLDLFSGCGATSTGLCLGANLSGVKLVTKWAVELNEYACQSQKYNHPETEVRNEKVEEFLAFLKEWERLCAKFLLTGDKRCQQQISSSENESNHEDGVEEEEVQVENEDVFEVDEILSICYGLSENDEHYRRFSNFIKLHILCTMCIYIKVIREIDK